MFRQQGIFRRGTRENTYLPILCHWYKVVLHVRFRFYSITITPNRPNRCPNYHNKTSIDNRCSLRTHTNKNEYIGIF